MTEREGRGVYLYRQYTGRQGSGPGSSQVGSWSCGCPALLRALCVFLFSTYSNLAKCEVIPTSLVRNGIRELTLTQGVDLIRRSKGAHTPVRLFSPPVCYPDVKIHSIAIVIKTAWYWLTDRQWNKIESPEVNPVFMVNGFSTEVLRLGNGERTVRWW